MRIRQAGIIVIMGAALVAAPQFLYSSDPPPLPVSTYNQSPPSTPHPASAQNHQKQRKEKKSVKKQQKWTLKWWS